MIKKFQVYFAITTFSYILCIITRMCSMTYLKWFSNIFDVVEYYDHMYDLNDSMHGAYGNNEMWI